MDIFHITNSSVTQLASTEACQPAHGFLWLDATHEEVAADVNAWRDTIENATGIQIYEPHLKDATNLAHPSYFDSTHDYAMVVFRKLALEGDNGEPQPADFSEDRRRMPLALPRLLTKPVTFLLLDRALITVHAAGSRTIDATRARLLDYRKRDGNGLSGRPPSTPEELMLRLLNGMVDQYLALRQPLTNKIDRWQRALLDPHHRFDDWNSLLDARIELRKLDHLCEGQRDAMQELRDYLVETQDGDDNNRVKDLMLVRVNDVMEHITRVLNHAQRLEATIESAVQIHFSAMAHRTSEIMRTLTVITALFMPLTLITGVFGMNFATMPLLENRHGFWVTMAVMAAIVAVLLLLFRRKRYLDDRRRNTNRVVDGNSRQ